MVKSLDGKIAVVTGASRGIGAAIALVLARQGADVVLAARSMDLLGKIAGEVERAGGRAMAVGLELESEESIVNLVKRVEQEFGRLDILVNNAGLTHSASFAETTTEVWDRLMRVNARGPFILCRQSLELLKKSEHGRIINIASVVGVKGYPLQSAYTASKHALRGMSISLAEELRATNVRVHVICPGGVDTEMVEAVRPDIKKDELIAPTEIAELVCYLASHKGNAVIDELHIRRESSGPWF